VYSDYKPNGIYLNTDFVLKNSIKKFKDTKIISFGDSITAGGQWLQILSNITGISDVKNFAIGGANIGFSSSRPIDNPYDYLSSYPNTSEDTYNDRHLLPQIEHCPNTLRHKYSFISEQNLVDGSYIYSPDIVIIAIGFNDYKNLSLLEDYNDVKDLTYDELISRKEDVSITSHKLYTYLRICLEKLMNSQITETRDGLTYGIDCRMANYYFVTPIQSSYINSVSGIDLKSFGDFIQKVLDDYSIKRIDGFRDIGICSKYEENGVNKKYLKDGIHPNDKGYLKYGNYVANFINSSYSEY